MGFLNKLKGVFFEEEIIEVEDSPKKEKDKPIAKKIELPKAEKKPPKEDFEEESIVEEEIKEPEKKVEFQNFEDDDFRETKEIVNKARETEEKKSSSLRRSERHENFDFDDEPVVVKEEEKPVDVYVKKEPEPKYDFEMEYGKNKEEDVTVEEHHGLYEGRNSKKTFTPTPVISPVFGILDKNYKKDDVVTKKEVRLSSISPKKMDLDSVREKAYGDLTNDISQSMEDNPSDEKDIVDLVEDDDENLLYDLNDDSTSPELKEVTVGDAEEYFNDLGLEYNVDYKDNSTTDKNKTSKEKARRSTRKQVNEEKEEEINEEIKEEKKDSEEMDSNLFDLIESMYDEKE